MKLVSIIMASYNKSAFIHESIDSILNQTYPNWELLIVDDFSTDNTVKILESLTSDKRVKLYKNESNRGANFCRNFGLKNAGGDFVIFMDADDLLAVDCLANRVTHAGNYPNEDLLVFTMGVFHKIIGDDKRSWVPTSKNPLRNFLRHKLPWSILQPLWKRDFLIELGGFDESFSRLQDVELNTRALFHPTISFKQIVGREDCYYRIDDTRKNYNAFEMMTRYVKSASDYYNKFYGLAKQHSMEADLMGTIYKTFQLVLYQYKIGNLSEEEMKRCKGKLFAGIEFDLGFIKKNIFGFAEFYNLLPLRIPGVNWLLFNMCTI
jgi:glycosyltransferase involved in cell wall biosynthesis